MDEISVKIYEQVNENWRFLAKWRQLAFAGYFAVLAGALSFINFATEHAYSHQLIGGFFLFLAGICLIFWIADRRTHQLTMQACRAGVALEDTKPGFFRVNDRLDKEAGVTHSGFRGWWKDSHSRAALLLFLGSMLIFGYIGGEELRRTPVASDIGGNSALWDYTVIHGTVTVAGTSSGSLEKDLNRAAADGWELVGMGSDSGAGTLVILRRHRR